MIKWLLFYFKIEQKNVIKANVMYDWIMHDVFVNDRHHYDDDCSCFRIVHVTT